MGRPVLMRLALLAMAIAGLALLGPAGAWAQDPLLQQRMFPEQIGASRRVDVIDFEKTNPGLGYGAQYQLRSWTITAYMYALKLSSIPDDAASPVIAGEFEKAKGDLVGAGKYASTSLRSEFRLPANAPRPRLACAQYLAMLKEGGRNDTYVCVGGWSNKFVKFRISVVPGEISEAQVRSYLELWVRHLWNG